VAEEAVEAARPKGNFFTEVQTRKFANQGPQPQKATVNIGLKIGKDGELFEPARVRDALERRGLRIVGREQVWDSNSEPTFVARLNRPMTAKEGESLSAELGQEAIAQYSPAGGTLFGPRAQEWGPFNSEFFLMPRERATLLDYGVPEDMAQPMSAKKDGDRLKPPLKQSAVDEAVARRRNYEAEPAVTPGPQASDADWAKWGQANGVNMTVTPKSEIAPGIAIPGGLDGTFTIPDLFEMKANNFDPKQLPRETQDKLYQKLARTYTPEGGTTVGQKMRAMAFTQLSANAPLLANEFIAQRLRPNKGESLSQYLTRVRDANLKTDAGVESSERGGMGVRGTADPNWIKDSASLLEQAPDAFTPRDGEGLNDVAIRLGGLLPGMGQKTASLGVPFFDLMNGDTSAIDLHMIRDGWKGMLTDPMLGRDFRRDLAAAVGMQTGDRVPTAKQIIRFVEKQPGGADLSGDMLTKVRGVIEADGGSTVYREKRSGAVSERVPSPLRPENLGGAPEPTGTIALRNPYYDRMVERLGASAGDLSLFLNQWRRWDEVRGRFEPHEFAHPDWDKLPKQGFSEMKNALAANRAMGFADEKGFRTGHGKTWRDAYYGRANPLVLAGIAGGGLLGAYAMSGDEAEEDARQKQERRLNRTERTLLEMGQ